MHPPRESIFGSTIRAFFKAFATIFGLLVGIGAIFVLFSIFFSAPTAPQQTELTVAPDAEGNRELLPDSAPVLLRIDFHGVIGAPNLDSDTLNNILFDSHQGVLKNNRVKGILLHMNTPGGTVTDADNMFMALKEYKKKYNIPVYVFVDGMCASGGIYISSSGDKIYATAPSLIGSVGVIMGPTFNFVGTLDKIGAQALTITQGKGKDALNPFRPWSPGEDQPLRDITATLYDRFVAIVTEARPNLNKEKLVNEYGANVFLADLAQQYGYIDEANSDYSKAVQDLAQAAGIKEKESYQVFVLAPKVDFFSELTQSRFSLFKGKISHDFQLSPLLSEKFSGKLLYLYVP